MCVVNFIFIAENLLTPNPWNWLLEPLGSRKKKSIFLTNCPRVNCPWANCPVTSVKARLRTPDLTCVSTSAWIFSAASGEVAAESAGAVAQPAANNRGNGDYDLRTNLECKHTFLIELTSNWIQLGAKSIVITISKRIWTVYTLLRIDLTSNWILLGANWIGNCVVTIQIEVQFWGTLQDLVQGFSTFF